MHENPLIRPSPSRPRPHRPWLTVGVAAAVLSLATPLRAQPAPTGAAVQTTPALRSVLLLGATDLPLEKLGAAYAPLLGQPADAALLERLRKAIAAAHDEAGLSLVAIDLPRMQGAVALVRIQPLVLRQLAVVIPTPGAEPLPAPALQGLATAALPALRPGQTPDLGAVDRQLRLANLQPNRRWAVDFRGEGAAVPVAAAAPGLASLPGQTLASQKESPAPTSRVQLPGGIGRPGPEHQIDVRVTVSDADPVYGRLMFDNAGQSATGRERVRLQLGHTDLLGPGRSVDLTALVSLAHPGRQQQVALRVQNPVPAWETLFAAELSRARSRPGVVQEFFGIAGDSRSLNLSARKLLPRRGGLEAFAELAIESSVHDDVVDFFGTNLGSKVGTVPLGFTLGATWQGGPWSAYGQARLRHNTGWGPHATDAAYASARAGATPDWTTLDLVGEARRGLGRGHEAVVRGQAQMSSDALVSPQQFRAGGANLMRGLPEGELAGDRGIALAVEYWFPLTADHRLGGLLDWAAARRNQALAAEPASASATSIGLAWHWQVRPTLRLQTAVAHLVSAHRLPQSRSGDSRVHLLLDWAF